MPVLTVAAPRPGRRHREPITSGVPWPRGVLFGPTRLTLVDARGDAVPLQTRALDHWSDGSLRWVLLDWHADLDEDGRATYRVEPGDGPKIATPTSPLSVTTLANGLLVDTGAARFEMRSGGRFPFEAVLVEGVPAFDPEQSRLTMEDRTGRTFTPSIEHINLVEDGPVRVAIRMEGGLGGLHVLAFLHMFAGQAHVRMDLTLRNPQPAVHPANLWDLGAGGSTFMRDVSWTLALPDDPAVEAPRIDFSERSGGPGRHFENALELYQDSSGGDRWDSRAHVNRDGVVPLVFPGYRLRGDGGEEFGHRASPIVTLTRGRRVLSAALEYFWQDFPKAIEADATTGTVTVRLFPRQSADVHELQGGERKTHRVAVAFTEDRVGEGPLDWCRAPALATAPPSWYAQVAASPYLTPKVDDVNATYLELVDAAIEGEDTFETKREWVDEHGWRHFGELYADHEAVFHRGDHPLVSHYNNQYDVVGGCVVQYLRSGDRRWWSLMREAARHMADIDVYHTDDDKSAYNHGLFWHTYHYVDAATGTHRAYSRRVGIPGGGPSGGHLYTTGLMMDHFLTGDPLARETAIELARYVIDADDGRRTVFRWLTGGHTGHVSGSAGPGYHGPGRAPANAINALVDGHRLTGGPAYLAKAEQLITRCVHPTDDLDARDLLHAETRWFYTMFLQALGKYLDVKAELDQRDRLYAQARASLLHHARWMADHECPYLDKPQVLEYPTETWAAQDMRKSDVFHLAARHAGPAERARFHERAGFFFESSIRTLATSTTRALARPVVLLMTNGAMHGHFQQAPDDTAAPPASDVADFGVPEKFVPQKIVAIRRARRIVLATAGLTLATLAAGMAWLFIGHR